MTAHDPYRSAGTPVAEPQRDGEAEHEEVFGSSRHANRHSRLRMLVRFALQLDLIQELEDNRTLRLPRSRKSAPVSTPNLFHVDVFASGTLSGNGLAVFLGTDGWPTHCMQRLTQEMKQFESIFLSAITTGDADARLFTVDEELPFAGHPAMGAAVVLHRTQRPDAQACSWRLRLASGTIPVHTRKVGNHHVAEMDQGEAVLDEPIRWVNLQAILIRLGLKPQDMANEMPARVISTGLPYLVLPVPAYALAQAAIKGEDFEYMLAAHGAKFVLLLDTAAREIRTWDNLGRVEDVATGSAAGPAAAYLYHHGFADPALPIELAQGRFAGRPSKMRVTRTESNRLLVSGEVWPVSSGVLDREAMPDAG